jgi:hypothetical protein
MNELNLSLRLREVGGGFSEDVCINFKWQTLSRETTYFSKALFEAGREEAKAESFS